MTWIFWILSVSSVLIGNPFFIFAKEKDKRKEKEKEKEKRKEKKKRGQKDLK
jgi:cytochrome c-type biogenesis protein CcmH/NrfF